MPFDGLTERRHDVNRGNGDGGTFGKAAKLAESAPRTATCREVTGRDKFVRTLLAPQRTRSNALSGERGGEVGGKLGGSRVKSGVLFFMCAEAYRTAG